MKANIHHTTSEDVERMKDYQLNRMRMLEKMETTESKNRLSRNISVMKLMSFPEFLNNIAPYIDEVKSNATEEE